MKKTMRVTGTQARRSALQLTAASPDLFGSALWHSCCFAGIFLRGACKAACPRVQQLVTRSRASIMRNRH